MIGMKPPQYVRSLDLANKTEKEIVVHVVFQSGTAEDFNVSAGSEFILEKEIQHDTWTAVDPIEKVSASPEGSPQNGSEVLTLQADGIVTLKFNIVETDGKVQLQQV